MSLAIFGAGYVGLVTSAGLASQGPVVVVDKDPSRVEALRRGVPVFHEPGLTEALTAGQVVFTTDPVLALARAEVAMITVGTPTRPDGGLDTSAVEAVVRSIAEHAQGPIIAVIRSTVPPGTTRRLRPIFEDRAPAGSTLAHVPEFLREGQALADFHAPARVVIGADDPATSERLGLLWGPFAPADKRFHTDPTTAELAKVGANTLLAGRVALVNELARIATATDADLHAALSVIGADPRIGPDYLAPGPGVGGSCLPKDVLGLGALATAADLQTPVVHAIHHSNQQQPAWVLDRLEAALDVAA